MENLYGKTLEELEEIIISLNEKPFRALQVFKWLYKPVFSFDEMSNISLDLRKKLSEKYDILHIEKKEKLSENDTATSKFLFKTLDNIFIEAVLLHYESGNSVCVSTQAGCKMGCVFCESGKCEFIRNLTSGEILDQIQMIEYIENIKVSNVVLMGTGEPLDNFENVVKFIQLATDKNSLNLSKRGITVSTCGIIENIYKLADSDLGVNLSISLHSPFHEERRELMPVENSNHIDDLIKAANYYREKTKRRITYEYCLIEGKNDTIKHIDRLNLLLTGSDSLVNVIGLNDKFNKKDRKYIYKFKEELEKKGVSVTIRRKLGSSINAACGQLRSGYINKGENI